MNIRSHGITWMGEARLGVVISIHTWCPWVIPNRGIPHHCPFRPGDHFFESPGCPWDAIGDFLQRKLWKRDEKDVRFGTLLRSQGLRSWNRGPCSGDSGHLDQLKIAGLNLWKIAIGDLPEAPVSRCSKLLRLEWHPCRIHWDWVTLSCRGSVSHNFRQYKDNQGLSAKLNPLDPFGFFKKLLLGTLGP